MSKTLYKSSRDNNGDWLDLFGEIQNEASHLFSVLVKKHPDIHPCDISEAIKSIIGYKAICVHVKNKRKFLEE